MHNSTNLIIVVIFILIQLMPHTQTSIMNNLYNIIINPQVLQQESQNSKSANDFDLNYNLHPDLSTVELITRRGYPVESHDIVTQDGYILTAFRIPYGRKERYGGRGSNFIAGKYPVFIMHGGAMSSSDWLINFNEDNCLPFLLANAGYDVWLGNTRGNMYANRHVNLTHHQAEFWNFSFDETADYDVPNTIDYILSVTKTPKLHYIAYSLGNTQFYMAMANKPEYNNKIGIHISYAASVFFGTYSEMSRLNALLWNRPLQILQKLIGGFPVPPQGITFMVNQILTKICNPKIDVLGVCRQLLFVLMGFGPDQISRQQTPSILGHLMTPTSLKMLIHLNQFMNYDRLSRYDYGWAQNLKMYGTSTPPEYDVRKITVPVALVLAQNDMFANIKGYERLLNVLPNIVDFYTIPNPTFSHIDFVYASSAYEMVYNHTLHFLDTFSHPAPFIDHNNL